MKNIPLFLFIAMIVVLGCRQPKTEVKTETPLPTTSPRLNEPSPTLSPGQTPKDVAEILKQIVDLRDEGRKMEPLRQNTVENAKKCGETMRKNQAVADNLRSKASALPPLYSTFLGPAAINLKMCVSCLSSASESCNMVDDEINRFNQRMKEK